MGRGNRGDHGVLIIIQNLPVPFDRRVWLECQALVGSGFQVSVVCPKGPGDPNYQMLEGVEIYKYRPFPPARRRIDFVGEYVYSFLMTALLTVKAGWRHHFDVVQACNPPDIFWPLALALKVTAGTSFVFDQHDLCPELYESRFPNGHRLPYRGLRILEWCTYRAADRVIATNASYRSTAIRRGGKHPDEVTIVRSGPDPDRLRKREPDPTLRRGRRFLVCYLGVMGPQDSVDVALRAAGIIVHQLGRSDVSFTFIGGGDSFDELVGLRDSLGLGDAVEFTGRAPDELVFELLSTADVGLCPDVKNPLNDVSTMNKTMEYMAFEIPVVAFDLHETRVSAGDAAVYAEANDAHSYATSIVELLDDEPRRRRMGALGRLRVERELAWHHQRRAYVRLYEELAGRRQAHDGDLESGA